MALRLLPDVRAYRLLESGPVVLVATRGRDGRANLMTLGFHMMVRHPSLIGVAIGPWDHSWRALADTGECVLAVPTVDLAEQVVDLGNYSGRSVDKFDRFGLTPRKASRVAAPLVVECVANIECRVADTTLVDSYDLWLLDAVAVWTDPHRVERRTLHHNGDGTFTVDGELLNLQEKMVQWKQFQD